jgi:hypothetical protein
VRDDEESRKQSQMLNVESQMPRASLFDFRPSTFGRARLKCQLRSQGDRGKSFPPLRRSLHTLRSFHGMISNTVMRDAWPAEESPLRVTRGNYR